ncbi:MAG: 50S ribosomal protein L4 [Bacilli bacterium]
MADITLKVYKQDGSETSTIKVSKDVFGVKVNESVMYNAVLCYQSNLRQATAKTKKRHEVSGGGKKPWRQKGTGRARAGSNTSPIWVGGGIVFGPTGEQSYKIKQNRKEHDLALKSAYTTQVKNLVVLDSLKVSGKTKEMVKVFEALKSASEKLLLITSDEKVIQGSGNLTNVIIRSVGNVSVYDLLNVKKVITTVDDVKKIEEDLE